VATYVRALSWSLVAASRAGDVATPVTPDEDSAKADNCVGTGVLMSVWEAGGQSDDWITPQYIFAALEVRSGSCRPSELARAGEGVVHRGRARRHMGRLRVVESALRQA
jgi:hypothetical protein